MTHEAQRIAIAEAYGWTDIRAQKIGNDRDLWGTKDGQRNRIPDYLSDLNAMHEAEKVLTYEQRRVYCGKLFNLPAKECESNTFATAAQRAKAFLRALNLWHPTP
jgi:hypothetical protein